MQDKKSDIQLEQQFEFRSIFSRRKRIRQPGSRRSAFPPNEACSEDDDEGEGAAGAGTFFLLVAADRDTGRIAGFLNGLATKERTFRDAFFTDAGLHDPNGDVVMLLGLDVLPEYRGRGPARKLMSVYAARERQNGQGSEPASDLSGIKGQSV